jgi:hypothetical protein
MTESKVSYCCEEFSKQASALQSMVGGGFLYPASARPSAQFEYDEDEKTWYIHGCCGGGCSVVTGMRFCPYCGTKIVDG